MQKVLFYLGGVVVLLGFVFWHLPLATSAQAQTQVTPPGLLDRGPLSKLTFIHYNRRQAPAKPTTPGGGKAPSCYGLLAKGAKWKTTENYLVNPTGSGVDQSQLLSALGSGVNQWEIYGGSAIFGTGSLDSTASISANTVDGKNVVVFGPTAANTIAVTTIWGYFGGPVQTRELVEWDMLFNTAYSWGDATSNATLMDVQNIATHELGHSAGLGDLYSSDCLKETMYGYSTEGETSKRDLFAGDISGIQALY